MKVLLAFVILQTVAAESVSTDAQEVTRASHATARLGNGAPLTEVTPVSRQFREKAEQASASIPDGVWRAINKGGWEVRVAEYVVDADPSLRGVRPRGWPEDATWEQTDAVHIPTKRLLIFAEKRLDKHGRAIPSTRVESVFRHEVGHAFDRAAGKDASYHSSNTAFVRAYQYDIAKIRAGDKERLAYYLQPGSAGRREVFAEAFAMLVGGGSDERNQPVILKSFPKSIHYVRDLLNTYATPRMVERQKTPG